MDVLRALAIRFWAKSAAVSSFTLLLARVSAGCAGLAGAPGPSIADAAATSTPDACTAVDAGDDAGPLTIRGHVRNPSGVPVVGAQVELTGALQATRSTDFTGGFTFHVSEGTYVLGVSRPCGSASSTVTLGDLTSNASPDLTATGTGCVTSTPSNVLATGEVLHLTEDGSAAGSTAINLGRLCTPGDTTCCTAQLDLSELQQIAADHPSSSLRWVTIAGYPAIEQQVTFTPSPPLCPAGCDPGFVATPTLLLTTTIAAGRTLVSFGTELQADASADAIALIVTAGESFTPEEIPELAAVSPDE